MKRSSEVTVHLALEVSKREQFQFGGDAFVQHEPAEPPTHEHAPSEMVPAIRPQHVPLNKGRRVLQR